MHHLFAHLVCPVDLHVGLPNPVDVRNQLLGTLTTHTEQCGIALLGSVAALARRGHLQDFADGLDPEGAAVLVDVGC